MRESAWAQTENRRQGLFKRYLCLGCGFLYDEALGLPEHGIAAGTGWADIPADWVCPDCGTPKSLFEMVEIAY
ncbi:MAG TPA: rubredoxin [Stellaceae bacterium]|nr:rubredoxin [Stellaceae bacterium]